MENIDYTRWAIYFIFGLPFLGWLALTRSQVLRVFATLLVLIVVQGSLANRRYLWAIGVGPSIIVAYTALMAMLVTGRRMPRLGWLGPGWGIFLFLALVGVVVGSLGDAPLAWNVNAFQELFVEAFVFFLVGVLAFRSDDEVQRFFSLLVLLGGFVAITHFFTLATGFRFRDFSQAREAQTWIYGAYFGNPNSLGAFYTMVFPLGLRLMMGSRVGKLWRPLLAVALVLMLGSLLLSTHRAGLLVTALLAVVALVRGGARPTTVAVGVAGGALGLGLAVTLVLYALPDVAEEVRRLLTEEGLRTQRGEIWLRSLQLVLARPYGIGLAPQNFLAEMASVGLPLATPHNIYLTLALETGIAGLFLFVAMVSTIVQKLWRAAKAASSQAQRRIVDCALLGMLGFLIVGFGEPVWENGYKLNHIFWLLSGIGLALADRVLAERRVPSARMASIPAQQVQAAGL